MYNFHYDEDTHEELIEQVLQYLVLLNNVPGSDLFTAVRCLVVTMATNEDNIAVRRKEDPKCLYVKISCNI